MSRWRVSSWLKFETDRTPTVGNVLGSVMGGQLWGGGQLRAHYLPCTIFIAGLSEGLLIGHQIMPRDLSDGCTADRSCCRPSILCFMLSIFCVFLGYLFSVSMNIWSLPPHANLAVWSGNSSNLFRSIPTWPSRHIERDLVQNWVQLNLQMVQWD